MAVAYGKVCRTFLEANIAPTPKQLAAQTHEALRALADSRAAAQAKVYFKPHDKIFVYGVTTPAVRRLERDLSAQVRGVWTMTEALSCCDQLLKDRFQEAKMVGLLLLSRYKKSFEPSLLARLEGWLEADYCANWAATDALCSLVSGPLVYQFPELIATLKRWTAAQNLWVRRAAIVSLIPLARQGQRLDEVYEIAELLFHYPEDLIHKATGWVLREAGKTDAARLEQFLLKHGARLPRTTLRYAIERFPEADRQRLLAATK